ncbi:MAG TPA: hypothetical protein VFQ45_03530 [Longimicrobium sp.]|nr:hypothetical protein [Longimicrobium sp.]
MRKLKLDLDDLRVDSFSTAAEGEGAEGTVYGYVTFPGCEVQQGPPIQKKTLPWGCVPPPSIAVTCNTGCFSCFLDCTFGPSCPLNCESHHICLAPTIDRVRCTDTDPR